MKVMNLRTSGLALPSLLRFAAAISLWALMSMVGGLVHAQSSGCDEGVIRLPDRSGTIQICSALSAQVPELSKQLAAAAKTLGNQDAQLKELTRLVKGLNVASSNIGLDRQGQMLQSLSKELSRSQRSGDEKTKRTIEDLSEQLSDLRDQMSGALANKAAAAATTDAIKGAVGDAIARLEINSASRQLDDIGKRLSSIQNDIGSVKKDTTSIRETVGRVDTKLDATQAALRDVKKETSQDPRKELANRGVQWSDKGFGDALMNGDVSTLELFFKAGWNPLSQYEEGQALAHFIWRSTVNDSEKIEKIIKMFVDNGVAINEKNARFRGLPPENIAINAAHACNSEVMLAALKLGANKENIIAALKKRSTIMPNVDGILNCRTQIDKIGAALGLSFRFEPKDPSPWGWRRDSWTVRDLATENRALKIIEEASKQDRNLQGSRTDCERRYLAKDAFQKVIDDALKFEKGSLTFSSDKRVTAAVYNIVLDESNTPKIGFDKVLVELGKFCRGYR